MAQELRVDITAKGPEADVQRLADVLQSMVKDGRLDGIEIGGPKEVSNTPADEGADQGMLPLQRSAGELKLRGYSRAERPMYCPRITRLKRFLRGWSIGAGRSVEIFMWDLSCGLAVESKIVGGAVTNTGWWRDAHNEMMEISAEEFAKVVDTLLAGERRMPLPDVPSKPVRSPTPEEQAENERELAKLM